MQGNIIWVSISWEVIHGKKLGRTIWVPTANIFLENEQIWAGVYACNIVISGKIYFWVGTYLQEKKLFEVFIFDFALDIYWKKIEIVLLEKIRENRKLKSLESLKVQIQKDITISKELQFPVLTFGSFDIFHEGHRFYLSEAKKYARTLITIIARDETIERIKWRPAHFREQKRKKIIEKSFIPDITHVWDAYNPFIWLETYKPKIIMLGYDQRGRFVEELPKKLIELWLNNTKIMRARSLEPEKYKSSLLRKVLKKEND